VLGFTVVFVALGALAGTLGGFLKRYQTAVDIVTGGIVILFGLNFLGVLKLNIFRGGRGNPCSESGGFFASVLFGIVFSVGWTPCVGAFLGSALMLVASQGHVIEGMLMLLCYSVWLGVPFVLGAVLIDRLKSAFDFIKKHYRVINIISGLFLVLIGVLMATGLFGRWIALLS
jgi:cytochrome c-type biogenesis protein